MIPLTLADIAAATGGTLHDADMAREVTGPLLFDSRAITEGGLFACLPGRTTDGHAFAEHAVRNGAAAALATRPVGVPAVVVPDVLTAMSSVAQQVASAYDGTVIGITGSAGKTSTKDLLAAVLSLAGPTVATPRSFNNEIGFPVTVTQVRPETRFLVLEMGARGRGHIAALCDIVPPAIATVLGVGSAHIGEFGSREAIAEAKSEIVQALPPHGVAVLNADDPLVAAMAGRTGARPLLFGITAEADVQALDIDVNGDGQPFFTLAFDGEEVHVQLAAHGRHQVTNALAAAATAVACRVPLAQIAQGLSGAQLVSGGRMEVITRTDGAKVINDAFNASPESVLAALESLADIGAGRRRVAVLGRMAELGTEAVYWHEQVGKAAAKAGLSHLIIVGGEDADALYEAARSDPHLSIDRVQDSSEVTELANALIEPNDVVLVKGANALGLDAVAKTIGAHTGRTRG